MIVKCCQKLYAFSTIPKWATVDPYTLNADKPYTIQNLLDGKWITYGKNIPIVDPLNGGTILHASTPEGDELNPYI